MADEQQPKPEVTDYFPGKGAPSMFSNQFYVLVGAGWSRLSLGEQVYNEPPSYHATFTMPTASLKELAETILRLIADQQPARDAAAKAAAEVKE